MASSTRTNGGETQKDFEAARADLISQIDALKGDISELTETVSKLASSGAGVAAKRASAKAHAVGDAGRETAARAAERFEQNTEQLADYARRKPLVALAAAAGAGLLIGYLTTPRR